MRKTNSSTNFTATSTANNRETLCAPATKLNNIDDTSPPKDEGEKMKTKHNHNQRRKKQRNPPQKQHHEEQQCLPEG
ncbi:hypothetical protein TNCV_3687141 [Trichonephila clavipes]|nr:hypothetical protein TNCV_3687141 [Trichonephila clavipes]